MLSLRVNETTYELDIDPDTPLLWVLRDHLGLTGTKYSCGIAQCGACTVHVNGKAVLSCIVSAGQLIDSEITTIEGLSGPIAEALRRAWIVEDVPQCGYCQPGQIMTAAALLYTTPHPTEADIDEAMSRVLCRCGTYLAIRRAIHRASREI
jgi:aerobic-type carbon monoxide dehydrogenase small subunit (CoxS/CutS family)